MGDEEEEGDEIVINHHNPASNQHGEDIPFCNEYGDTANQTPLVNRNAVVPLEEERPDTGMKISPSDQYFIVIKIICTIHYSQGVYNVG